MWTCDQDLDCQRHMLARSERGKSSLQESLILTWSHPIPNFQGNFVFVETDDQGPSAKRSRNKTKQVESYNSPLIDALKIPVPCAPGNLPKMLNVLAFNRPWFTSQFTYIIMIYIYILYIIYIYGIFWSYIHTYFSTTVTNNPCLFLFYYF